MNIVADINELLIDTDCVIIPGLGGFVANYQSAMVSGNAHVQFMPPSKQLLFNTKLIQNDGLLVSKLSRKQNISYKVADEEIAKFVYEIKKQLHTGGSFSFEGIGILLLTANNVLSFQPTVAINLYADSFGLSSFMFPQLQYGIRAKQHVSFNPTSIKRTVVVKKSIKRIAVVVPMLLLLAILPTVYLKNVQQSSFSFFSSSKIENNKVISSAVLRSKTKRNKILPVIVPKVCYHIIIGCFRNERTAQTVSETFKAKGFKTSVLTLNNMYKVSLQAYNDSNEAYTALHSFQDANKQFADSWLLTLTQ
jgi:hypothetical protein